MKLTSLMYISLTTFIFHTDDGMAQSCLQSFNVKRDKPLLTYDWLPGKPDSAQTLTCVAAEKLREKIYITSKEQIDAAANGSPTEYLATAQTAISEAESKVNDLEAAVRRNESLSGLQLVGEVMLYELGKADLLITCLAPDATVSKLFCGAGFISLGLETYRILNGSVTNNEFKQMAVDSRSQLKTTRSRLSELKLKLNKDNFWQISKNNVAMFNGLCAAIKKDCL